MGSAEWTLAQVGCENSGGSLPHQPTRPAMSFLTCCFRSSEPNEPQRHKKPRRSRIRPDDRGFELLLLGADGSGKSTFIRQMQIIHGRGFNDKDKMDLIPHVYDNIFDAMKVLVLMI